MREALGLNRPLLEQYLNFIGGLVRLDLGKSHSGPPVTDAILEVLPWTLTLFALAIGLGLLIGFPLGRRIGWQNRPMSPTLMAAAMATSVFPPWMALVIANIGFTLIGATVYTQLRSLDEVMWDTPPSPVNVLWWVIAGLLFVRNLLGLDYSDDPPGKASMAPMAWASLGPCHRHFRLGPIRAHPPDHRCRRRSLDSFVRPDAHDGRRGDPGGCGCHERHRGGTLFAGRARQGTFPGHDPPPPCRTGHIAAGDKPDGRKPSVRPGRPCHRGAGLRFGRRPIRRHPRSQFDDFSLRFSGRATLLSRLAASSPSA